MIDAAEQLIDAMQDELQGQRKLLAVLDNKLDAMRVFDVSRLEALRQNEKRLLDNVRMLGQRRAEAVRLLTRQLLPRRDHDLSVTARELAQAAPEPARTKILTLSAMLKDVAQDMQRINRISNVAANKILGHFDQIFRIIAQSGRDIGLYGRAGKRSLVEQNRLVDAVV